MPPEEKPRKTPTTWSRSKRVISTSVPGAVRLALLVSTGRDVGGHAQLIDDVGEFGADLLADRLDQVVLDDIEVQVGYAGVIVGLLQAVGVERHGKPGDGVGEQVPEHGLCVGLLAVEQV